MTGKSRHLKMFFSCQSGLALLETVVALAVAGAIAIILLNGLAITAKSTTIADEQTTGESIARSQMEWIREVSYVSGASTYSPGPFPAGADYTGYSVAVTAASLHNPDDGIQKITIAVSKASGEMFRLESYKVLR